MCVPGFLRTHGVFWLVFSSARVFPPTWVLSVSLASSRGVLYCTVAMFVLHVFASGVHRQGLASFRSCTCFCVAANRCKCQIFSAKDTVDVLLEEGMLVLQICEEAERKKERLGMHAHTWGCGMRRRSSRFDQGGVDCVGMRWPEWATEAPAAAIPYDRGRNRRASDVVAGVGSGRRRRRAGLARRRDATARSRKTNKSRVD